MRPSIKCIFKDATSSQIPLLKRNIHTTICRHQRFEPLLPQSPESLGAPRKAATYPRTSRWARRLLYTSLFIGAGYTIDSQFYASSITRSLRTFGTGLLVASDYKINFRENGGLLGGSITDLHRRSAERLFNLLRENGGLYLKIGQAIAMQSAVMPPEFQAMFARMFDDAPQNDWKDVEKVIREEFGGRSVEEVFGRVMERKARASASVAQVHWCRLEDGREVAVKVQKREIRQQVGWDLWAFKVVMYIYTKWFDLPLYSVVPYITERLMLETDFENEANNSMRMAEFIATEPRLRDRVYIPKVYPELSTQRVMTAEWIEGVRLWDKETLTNKWQGGRGVGSPGADGKPLGVPTASNPNVQISTSNDTKLKPERDAWKGKNGKGGLGLSLKEIMTTMIDLFSAQMFIAGLVHCDPHPGNIFLRRLPNGRSQLVLIDHGLYITMTPHFRHQYSLFWKSLLTFDNATLSEITSSWGVRHADLFASATLMRPYEGGDASTRARITTELKGKTRADRHYEVQERMRQGIRDVLADEDKWPRELLFIGRNMRIVQGNNQFLGSPVNRIKLTGTWASRSLVDDPNLSYGQRAINLGRHLIFKCVMLGSDLVFYTSKVKQWLGLGLGMEDDMEKQLRVIAKDTFGVELQHGVFEG